MAEMEKTGKQATSFTVGSFGFLMSLLGIAFLLYAVNYGGSIAAPTDEAWPAMYNGLMALLLISVAVVFIMLIWNSLQAVLTIARHYGKR